MSKEHSFTASLLAGFAGALAVNVVHELTRHAAGGDPSPARVPRLDRLGMAGVDMVTSAIGLPAMQPGKAKYATAMTGDIVTNSLLYALVAGVAKRPFLGGGLLSSIAAGVSGLVLPKLVGLGEHTGTTKRAKSLTFLDYAIGGVVTGAVLKLLSKK